MKVQNISKGTLLGSNISLADTFLKRTLGLIPRSLISKDEGLVIDPCNSIHMFFMRFPIDVLFIDKDNIVVHIVQGIKPWRVSKIVWNSKYVIELPAGVIGRTGTEIGDKVNIEG